MIKWLIVIAMLMHGIGHLTFALHAFVGTPVGFTDAPWLLPGGFVATSAVGKAFALVWFVAMIGFVGAAIGLATGQPWWASLAVMAAVLSLVVLLPWWNTITPSSRVWALLADVAVIVAFGFPWREQVIAALQ